MEWVLSNWEYVALIILAIDKLVTMTPPGFTIGGWDIGKNDDMIWSTTKGIFLKVFGKTAPKVE